jgi:FkbM family methyltransferase
MIKHLIIGTPLERPARRFYKLLAGRPPISEWDLREARDNAYIRALLRGTLKRTSNCIDVGAHSGVFLHQFLEFAPEGRHWAFEPIPAMADELRRKFSTVEVHSCALSDQDGHTTFQYVPERPAWSGLRPQPYPRATHPQSIPVTIKRLDSLIPDDSAIGFVKIDVEGAELEVLRGAEAVFRRCRPVVLFECGKIHHTHYATTPQDVHAFLTRCGMGVFLMDQTGPLAVEEFAAIYEASHRSGYDRTAWGNYLAMPV